MKKILATIILSLAVLSSASAQINNKAKGGEVPYDDYMTYKKSEISIQYGTPNVIEISPALAKKEIINNDYTFNSDGYWFSGVAGIGYSYYKSPYLYFSGYLGINASGVDLIDQNTDKLVCKLTMISYTALVGVNWIYYREGIVELSSGFSLGATIFNESINSFNRAATNNTTFSPKVTDGWRPAFNITAIKARFGGNIGGFVELGFGYKGIINAGLSVKF